MEQTLLLLQLSDSAFPTGGFSHSLGLESSVQHKQIQHTGDLKSFITCLLENAGSFSIPFIQEAHTAQSQGDMDWQKLKQLDHLCHVCTVNHVANRASSRQGKAMVDTANKVFQIDFTSNLRHRHYPVVYGAVCGALGLSCQATLASFMSGVARTSVASAVRLDKIGPVEAQRILTELQKIIPEIITRNITRSADDACITFPVIDVLQNRHDTLFCKLFYS